MRLDEVALASVHETEPHCAAYGTAVPGNPQVLIRHTHVMDLVVAHAAVLRKDDLDRVATDLQLPTESEDHLAEAPGLRHRRTFRGDHHRVHGYTHRSGCICPAPRQCGPGGPDTVAPSVPVIPVNCPCFPTARGYGRPLALYAVASPQTDRQVPEQQASTWPR